MRTDVTSPGDAFAALWQNYLHRALAAGVYYGDLQQVRGRMTGVQDWAPAWSAEADLARGRGEAALAGGFSATAGAEFARAALSDHFAQLILFEEPDEKARLHRRAAQTFRTAAPHLQPPLERVEVPFRGATLPGYLRLPVGARHPPCVILVGGLDSTKEEHLAFSGICADRGLASLSFEGPGQGETFHRFKLAAEDFVAAGRAVVDFAMHLPGIDAGRLGIMGRSMGGHFAPRVAAADERIKALAVWGAMFHLSDHANLPPLAQAAFRHATGLEADDLAAFFATMDLGPIASRIRQPTIIVHSGRDAVTPTEHAVLLRRAVSGPVELLFWDECRHCAFEKSHIVMPALADFLAAQLGDVSMREGRET